MPGLARECADEGLGGRTRETKVGSTKEAKQQVHEGPRVAGTSVGRNAKGNKINDQVGISRYKVLLIGKEGKHLRETPKTPGMQKQCVSNRNATRNTYLMRKAWPKRARVRNYQMRNRARGKHVPKGAGNAVEACSG